jgi:hypothetical protein
MVLSAFARFDLRRRNLPVHWEVGPAGTISGIQGPTRLLQLPLVFPCNLWHHQNLPLCLAHIEGILKKATIEANSHLSGQRVNRSLFSVVSRVSGAAGSNPSSRKSRTRAYGLSGANSSRILIVEPGRAVASLASISADSRAKSATRP